ncbi:MAG: phosphoribosyltransferase family protein [Patescibacteria group bacterium]
MSMYFKDRAAAGSELAKQLMQFRYENSIVIGLSDGGVAVAEPIATALHCLMTLLLLEDIKIPGEPEPFGSVNQYGKFSQNSFYSAGEIEGMYSEFHGVFEQQQRENLSHMNALLGDGGILSPLMVKDRVVILVTDGLLNGASLDAAMEFLKPIRTRKIIIVAVLATRIATDKMHLLADEIYTLAINDDMLEIDHYFEDNTMPTREQTIAKINQAVLNWK